MTRITIRCSILIGALFFFLSGAAFAGVTLPSTPGLTYRIAFVTSGGTSATDSNIADYNSFVAAYAPTGDPRLSGLTWSAIVSTTASNADDNSNTNPANTGLPIYNTAGQLVAANNATLWNGFSTALSDPVLYDEDGNNSHAIFAWTGTYVNGIAYSGETMGESDTILGNLPATNSQWVYASFDPDTLGFPLYGISSPITNPVPEPATFLLAAMAMLGIYCRHRFQRARRRS